MPTQAFNFGEWLKRQIAVRGVPVKTFAARVKVSEATLHLWMTKQAPVIRGFNRGRLAAALEIPITELDAYLESAHKRVSTNAMTKIFERGTQFAHRVEEEAAKLERQFDANVEPYSERRHVEVPVFDMTVAAGRWVDVTDVGEVMKPGMIDHGFFRVRIRGDSMTPAYQGGDLVEFRCMRELRDVLAVGKDYYVQKHDGTATFKRLAEIGEEELVLHALNAKKYPKPMPVTRAEIVRMAVAVAKVTLV